MRRVRCVIVAGVLLCAGCKRSEPAVEARPATQPKRAALVAPSDSQIPDGPLGQSIRRGLAILTATKDSLPQHTGNGLRCVSCHLDNGRRANAMPWVGVYGRFPQYRARSGRVITIEDRINGCFQRSLNGSRVDPASTEMRDMVAYMAFLSSGIPVGSEVEGQGTLRMRALEYDTIRGEKLFAKKCAQCHGDGGLGTGIAPALWGPQSYNVGAGMARIRTAAAFIRANMPFDKPGSLSDQEAFDIAAYVDSRSRPDFPGKENDWPNGDPPPDVAYQTKASQVKPALTPPVIPRQ